MKQNLSSIKYFTQKELKKLFRTIEKEKDTGYDYWLRDSVMFNIGYLCGLRISEIGNLKLDHYNPQRGEIFCPRVKKSVSNVIRLDQKRIKILNKYLREYGIKEGESPLFLSKRKKPISVRRLDQMMKGYAQKAQISDDKAHWHSLKHSIAVHLAESGADVKEVQNYLGHKDIKNTMIYFEFTTKQKDAFYEKIRRGGEVVR